MSDFYNRQFELYITDKDKPFIEATNDRQFKMVFSILIDFGGANSYADITIYNLSKDTEGKVFKKGEYVGFRAGYETTIDYIFKGEIVNIIREKIGSDKITRLICKGGAVSQESKTINKSFSENISIVDLCKECAEALGFPLTINSLDFPAKSPYLSGYILQGDPKKFLNKLAKAHNFSWLIENEKLVVVGNDSSRGGYAVEVSSSNGMVGVPEITEIGADAVVRLNPTFRIGGEFEIKSEFAQVNYSNVYFQDVPETIGQGVYVVQGLQHEGDTYGDKWDTKVSGLRKKV